MIRVTSEPFDIAAEICALTDGRTDVGAVVSFTGLVRDLSQDVAGEAAISAMTLEHYPGMTERALEAIETEARDRWPLTGVTIVHRYGRLEPGDQIVLVVTASAHRRAAFEAADFLMDYLKTRAPFWKREETPEGSVWVEARAHDDAAADRWRSEH